MIKAGTTSSGTFPISLEKAKVSCYFKIQNLHLLNFGRRVRTSPHSIIKIGSFFSSYASCCSCYWNS
ncbi:hypothetical protein OFP88_10535 [Brachyspira hyodysenteriae]|uniref:hypothetical protein n=1 Tax=Brachyspira hyodysenteriae TaxID=159 RepID=UPI0022CDF4A9|nr:hypothetical protein [Brachyspira hyodysenteriae]MCZ9876467.1 hypothetical protein [Brachyspira hyodysenteriae]